MQLPDLTPIFYLAIFGLFCGVLFLLGGVSWAGYHVFMALCEYNGYCRQ